MATEIRFSENEKRNFASALLSMLKTQNEILVAMATGASHEKIIETARAPARYQDEYKSVIEVNDLNDDGLRSGKNATSLNPL